MEEEAIEAAAASARALDSVTSAAATQAARERDAGGVGGREREKRGWGNGR